jgi:hypothetical protein
MATVTRRSFLEILGLVGVVFWSFPVQPGCRLAFRDLGKGGALDTLVVIFQRGGMDGLNVVVPYGEGAPYYDKRPSIAIPAPGKGSSAALDLNGFFGLHPALEPLKEIYDARQVKVIHAAGSPDPSRSHFEAMEYMERGTPGERMTSTGWLNRHLQTAAWQNDSPFRAVGMGAIVQGALRGPISALALKSIADFHLEGRQDQLAAIQKTLGDLYSIRLRLTHWTDRPPRFFGRWTCSRSFPRRNMCRPAAPVTPMVSSAWASSRSRSLSRPMSGWKWPAWTSAAGIHTNSKAAPRAAWATCLANLRRAWPLFTAIWATT